MSAERLSPNNALAASATAERIRNTIQVNSEVSPVRNDAGHVIGYTLDASVPAAMLAAEMGSPAPAAESAERLAELSAKASFGKWIFRLDGHGRDPALGSVHVPGGPVVIDTDLEGSGSITEADGEFVCAIVNAYRTGHLAPAASGGAAAHCDLGVGCDEYGVCFAEAHGEPDRCGRTRGGAAADLARVEAERTPASRWRAVGEPDPHGARYDCERSKTIGGKHTDDEVANMVFLDPNIMNLTIAKDRIRWLSRSLVAAEAALTEAKAAAERMREALRLVQDDVRGKTQSCGVVPNSTMHVIYDALQKADAALSTTPSVSGETEPASREGCPLEQPNPPHVCPKCGMTNNNTCPVGDEEIG